MKTIGVIDFSPLVEANRIAKENGVSPEEIEANLDNLLVAARKAVLAEDKHLTWAIVDGRKP
jgi:hypothetical protein